MLHTRRLPDCEFHYLLSLMPLRAHRRLETFYLRRLKIFGFTKMEKNEESLRSGPDRS